MIPIIIISLLILAYCSELKQSVTCEETLGLMLGPAAKITTEILVLLYCFGTCVAFLTVMGDQIEDGKHAQGAEGVCVVISKGRDYQPFPPFHS